MTPRQMPPIGYEREMARRRSQQTRLQKNKRRGDWGVQEPPAAEVGAPQESFFQPKSNPSSNYFSVLGESNGQTNQIKVAIDIVNTTPRRRAKRSGKNSISRQDEHPTRHSEGHAIMDKLRGQFGSLSLDNKDGKRAGTDTAIVSKHQNYFGSQPEVETFPGPARTQPPAAYAFSMSRPNTAPFVGVKINPPEPAKLSRTQTPEMSDYHRSESRRFSMRDFLAQSELTTRRSPTNRAAPLPSDQQTSIEMQSAEGAAFSAATRALSFRNHKPAPLTLKFGARPSSPAPQPPFSSTCIPESSSFKPRDLSPMPLPSVAPAPSLPITPSHTVPPTLTISPTIPTTPSLSSTPTLVSKPTTPSFSTAPFLPPYAMRPTPPTPWPPLSPPDPPAAPTSPAQLDIPPPPIPPRNPKRLLLKPLVPAVPRLLPPLPPNVNVKQDLPSFLAMGHAKPCWCAFHRSANPSTLPGTQLPNPSAPVIRSLADSGVDLGGGVRTPSPTSSDSSASDFEHLDLDLDLVTLSSLSDSEHSSFENADLDEGWMVVENPTLSNVHVTAEDDDGGVLLAQREECASASAVEWPRLGESVGLKRKRGRGSSGEGKGY
ncbi:hypothetical protein EJ04DRAFT_554475 [Polyplosphaeria fusca]|uniref:Uncharacterized protein n=1 Tax=Polyplosphaeria fusca TaxID=682080 RepID=A0A9P4QVH0_9PLEO|nr:hypothetical protein EJ04DRAFT_554475 [Polyplosphaeria fusca]